MSASCIRLLTLTYRLLITRFFLKLNNLLSESVKFVLIAVYCQTDSILRAVFLKTELPIVFQGDTP